MNNGTASRCLNLNLNLTIFYLYLVFSFGEKKKQKIDILTPILSSKYISNIPVTKHFNVKDPQNYMYLAADHHLEKDRSRDDQKQRFELQKFPWKNIYSKNLNTFSRFFKNSSSSIQKTFIVSGQNVQSLADIFMVSFKNSGSTAWHSVPRCELVDLLFSIH